MGCCPYTVEGMEIRTLSFTFAKGIKPGEERTIMIALNAPLVSRKDDYNEYVLLFTPRQDIGGFEHILRLPEDAELFSPREGFPAIVPTAEISRASGVMILTWRASLEADNPVVFLVRYKTPHSPILRNLAYALLSAVFFIVSLFVGKDLMRRYRRTKTLKSLSILNERERMVMAEIVKNGGIKQSVLMERLGFTKSSLSKILSRLEARGLIRKVKSGKINRLYPGDKIDS
jgi:uncharacterized membrane protein